MSRINTNVSSLIAQRNLQKNNLELNTSLQRLSTGLKINSGADDPAGLIAAQQLGAEKVGISAAIDNASRASNIVGTAEGGLSEVSSLLTELQSLVTQSANSGGLSYDEISANQLQVDSILSTINRIAGSTAFEGKQLLNGNYAYTTSGISSTNFNDISINAASVPEGGSLGVVVQVVSSAQTGTIALSAATLSSGATIELGGNLGTQQLAFASGTTVSSVLTAVNSVTSDTGVSAVLSGGTLVLHSTAYGASQYVSVKTISGTFATTATEDKGADASVTVNGAAASVDGKAVSYRAGNLDISFDITDAFNTPGNDTFQITGGGATFELGSKVTEATKASLGINSVSTANLGNNTDGFLSQLGSGGTAALNGNNLDKAQRIVTDAINEVATIRGRLGAFQKYTVDSTVNSLNVAFENVSSSQSDIQDADFSEETSNLTRSQILASAATTVLSQANARPQQALQLLQS